MILSLQDLFSNGQTIGTATGDTASTNTLDWASHKDDLSRNLSIFCKVDSAGTFGSGGTIVVKFQTSANNSDWTTLITTAALTTLAAGQMVINHALPKGLQKYNRILFTGDVAAFAVAPKFTAGIVRGELDYAFAGV